MQIPSLEQCFSCEEMVKMRIKREDLSIMSLIPACYERYSFLAYLRPTLALVVYTRIMRGTL